MTAYYRRGHILYNTTVVGQIVADLHDLYNTLGPSMDNPYDCRFLFLFLFLFLFNYFSSGDFVIFRGKTLER